MDINFDDCYSGNPDFRSETGCSDENGVMETYGEDYERVQKQAQEHPKTVWTIIDGYDGKLFITAGFHWVNRFLYFISNEEWADENEEYLWADFDEDEE